MSTDSETLNKQAKPELVESQMFALTALQLADSYMKKTIWYDFKIVAWVNETNLINQNAYWKSKNW